MDQLLTNAFKRQIEAKEGFAFEDFIDELFLIKHGADNYVPIRRVGDGGNDGTILTEQKVLACYAPRKYSKTDFNVKVLGSAKKEGDFEKYQKKWKDKFPNWEMYVNHEVAPEQLILIESLEGSTSIKGIDQILSIIKNELNSSQKRKLAKFLEIDHFFKQDYLQDILSDLLNDSSLKDKDLKFDKKTLIDLNEKIELNFDKEDIDNIHSELVFVIPDFNTIAGLLSGYEDNEKDVLKWRIIDDYGKLSGSFKERLINLTLQYTNQYGNVEDDEYRKSVKTVLLYMFEQCLIGKKIK